MILNLKYLDIRHLVKKDFIIEEVEKMPQVRYDYKTKMLKCIGGYQLDYHDAILDDEILSE